jgi:hypothetical protein
VIEVLVILMWLLYIGLLVVLFFIGLPMGLLWLFGGEDPTTWQKLGRYVRGYLAAWRHSDRA